MEEIFRVILAIHEGGIDEDEYDVLLDGEPVSTSLVLKEVTEPGDKVKISLRKSSND